MAGWAFMVARGVVGTRLTSAALKVLPCHAESFAALRVNSAKHLCTPRERPYYFVKYMYHLEMEGHPLRMPCSLLIRWYNVTVKQYTQRGE